MFLFGGVFGTGDFLFLSAALVFVSRIPGCPLRHIFAMRTPTKGPIQTLEVATEILVVIVGLLKGGHT